MVHLRMYEHLLLLAGFLMPWTKDMGSKAGPYKLR